MATGSFATSQPRPLHRPPPSVSTSPPPPFPSVPPVHPSVRAHRRLRHPPRGRRRPYQLRRPPLVLPSAPYRVASAASPRPAWRAPCPRHRRLHGAGRRLRQPAPPLVDYFHRHLPAALPLSSCAFSPAKTRRLSTFTTGPYASVGERRPQRPISSRRSRHCRPVHPLGRAALPRAAMRLCQRGIASSIREQQGRSDRCRQPQAGSGQVVTATAQGEGDDAAAVARHFLAVIGERGKGKSEDQDGADCKEKRRGRDGEDEGGEDDDCCEDEGKRIAPLSQSEEARRERWMNTASKLDLQPLCHRRPSTSYSRDKGELGVDE